MAKRQSRRYRSYQVEAGGAMHTVEIRRKVNKFLISINGQELPLIKAGSGGFWVGVYEDFHFEVAGKPLVLAVRGSMMKLADGGVYLDDGTEYNPPSPMPAWIWLFCALNALLLFYALGSTTSQLASSYYYMSPSTRTLMSTVNGGVAGAMAASGFIFCIYIAKGGHIGKKPLKSTGAKFAGCIITTAIAWGIWLAWSWTYTL